MTEAPRPKSRFWRRCLTCFRALRLTVWFLILALLGALVYVNQIGLPGFVKKPLLEKLRARGLDLQFSRLRLRWYQGLVAENVRFERADPAEAGLGPQLTLAEVQVRLNPQALARFQLQVDSLMLRQGRLVWPIAQTNPAGAGQLSAENIQTELRLLPDDQWALDHFTAAFHGARILLSGAVSNASAVREWKFFQASRLAGTPAGVWQDRLRRLADTLERIRFSAPPDLKLDVRGDARDLQSFRARLLVRTPGADTPWGTVTQGRFTARLFPPASNELSRAELRLEAADAQTPWANTTNLQFALRLTTVAELTNLVKADLSLLAGDVETQWGRATNARLSAQWVQALTNPVPLTGRGELTCDAAQSPWGNVGSLAVTGHLAQSLIESQVQPPKSKTEALSSGTEHGTRFPDFPAPFASWWTNLQPCRLDWEAYLCDLVSSKLAADEITCRGNWRAPDVAITHLHARLYQGQLDVQAALDVATRALNVSLASDVDPNKVSPLLTEGARQWLAQYSWNQPPELTADASLVLPAWTNRQPDWRGEVQPTLRLQGQFKFARGGAFREVPVTSARSHFSYSNLLWRLPDLVATRPEGRLSAAYEENDRTKDYFWRIASTIDVRAVRPLLETNQSRMLSGLDFVGFTQPPLIDVEIQGRWHDRERVGLKGRVALSNFTFRGEAASGFQTRLQYTNRFLQLTDAHAQLGTQQLSAASLAADFLEQKIYLTNGFSTADPQLVARAIGPKVGRALEPYRFDRPPSVRVEGIIPIRDERDADLHFDVKGGPFAWRKFHVPRLAGHVHWIGQRLTLGDVRAELYEGAASGWARFNFAADQGTDYQFAVATTNSNLQRLMADLAEHTNRLEGTLSGNLVITNGNSADRRTLAGYGSLDLRNGLIWDIPVFGIFSDVLNGISPGLGNSRASSGACTFAITNGLIHSDDLEIRSPALRLLYHGAVDIDGQINARVEAELLRDVWLVGPIVSTVLWPVTKAFEYKVTGSLNQPKAEPVYLIPKIVLLPFHPFRTLKDLLPEDFAPVPTNAPPSLTP
jgi:hypothetical protein